jgi:aryl sulfotransferase
MHREPASASPETVIGRSGRWESLAVPLTAAPLTEYPDSGDSDRALAPSFDLTLSQSGHYCSSVSRAFVRYRSSDEDSARWQDFVFRPGDIVISTRSKSGTTWMQMICALLVFQTPDLPAPLGELSPWLDSKAVPENELLAELESQRHRRFVKTHTPLDGIPLDPRVTYIVVARHPLDAAVSLYHQRQNIDRERLRQMTGQPEPDQAPALPPPVREWLLEWIDRDVDPRTELDSLPGFLWHLTDAWARRATPNIELIHYDDLLADLNGEMRRLARLFKIEVLDEDWPSLVAAAEFAAMRARAHRLAPTIHGVLKDSSAFFRRGRAGAGAELLTEEEMGHYMARVKTLGSPELNAWLHRDVRSRHRPVTSNERRSR